MRCVLARWIGGGVSIALLLCGVSRAQEPSVARAPDGRPDLSGIWRTATNRYLTDLDVTIDDPKAYTRPWTVTVRVELVSNADLGERVCAVQPPVP